MEYECIEAPEYVGVLLAASVLKDPVVREFIERVREREGIEPPTCQSDLEYNRQQHDLLAFVAEALPVADRHLGQALMEGSEAQAQVIDGPASGEEQVTVQLETMTQEPLGSLFGMFAAVFRAQQAVPAVARVISRFIVAGYLEPPEPIPSTALAIAQMPDSQGSFTIALIAPWANLDEATQRIKAVHRQHYGRRKRVRVPDKVNETLWLRFCIEDMGREPDSVGGYAAAAELSFEIWPLTRTKHPDGSKRYEAAVARCADRIRKRSRQWERFRDSILPEEPET